MSLNVSGILDALVSHAAASGLFGAVNTHEPKSKPGSGLTAAVWCQSIGPLPKASGLASTTTRVEFTLRVYAPMLSEPQDAIDPAVLAAVDVLLSMYTGDFTLGGLVRDVDVLGEFGTPLSAKAGYLHQDGTLFRVMDITVPCVVNDLWSQSE